MMTKRTENGNVPIVVVSLIIFLLIAIFVGISLFREGEREVQRPRRIAKRVKIEVPPPSLETDKELKPQISSRVKVESEDDEKVLQAPARSEKREEKPIIKKKEIATSTAVSKDRKEKLQLAKKVAGASENVVDQWVVNVISTPSKGDAMRFLARLEKGGYKGYITEFDYKNRLWYRVRIGFFSSKKEAKRVGGRLSDRYLVKSYWVVKASKDEVLTHSK